MQRLTCSSTAKASTLGRSQLVRTFCTPKDSTATTLLQKARVSYKPLILYSAGIGLFGALVGSFYTKTKIAVKEKKQAKQQSDEQAADKAKTPMDPQTDQSAQQEQSGTTEAKPDGPQAVPEPTLFEKVFQTQNLPFKLEELQIDDSLKDTNNLMSQDSVLILIPPVEDEEFLTTIRDLVGDVFYLHKQLHESRGESTTNLQVKFCKMRSIKDLQDFEQKSGITLMDGNNLPVMVVFNKLRLVPQVITLDTVLQEQEKFYSSFRPLQQVNKKTQSRFVRNIRQMPDDEIMLLRVAPNESEDQITTTQKELYEVLQSDEASHLKRVQLLYVQSQDWLSEVFGSQDSDQQSVTQAQAKEEPPKSDGNSESTLRTSFKLEPGKYYVLQKKPEDTWLGDQALQSTPQWMASGDFAIYPVEVSTDKLSPEAVLAAAGEEYYRRNAVSHIELPGQKPQFTLELAYDANKVNSSQQARVLQIFKKVRGLLDKAEGGEKVIKLRVYSKTFDPSEGRNIRLQFRDNQLTENRMKYMMETKTIEEREALLQQYPDLATNDSTELQFPEGFGFSSEFILKFIDLAMQKQIPDTPYGEVAPKYVRYSRKVVGESFTKQILNNPASQVLFLGSETCGSCKKFTPMYEELAKENITKEFELLGKPTVFNHMSKDTNDFPVGKNYLSTPIILLWRSDLKSQPFQYRSGYLSRESLQSFLQVSQEYKILPEESVTAHLAAVKKSRPLVN